MNAREPLLEELINGMETLCPEPEKGVGTQVFDMLSGYTPIINVDLLLMNADRQFLMTWRDDELHGSGWHLPGGILRFKEDLADRVMAVGRDELNVELQVDDEPLVLSECRRERRSLRGHFLSFLYGCSADSKPEIGQWFDCMPDNVIATQEYYGPFVDRIVQGDASRSETIFTKMVFND